jgi:hypothetical protein
MKAKTSRPTPKNPLLQRAPEDQELRRRIAVKAYELYRQRGCRDGHDREDWLEAERLVLGEIETPSSRFLAPRGVA